MKLCIVCQTYKKSENSAFCGTSCATIWSIIQAEQLILTSEELKQLALNRFQALDDYMDY